jgi:hypothetical protein
MDNFITPRFQNFLTIGIMIAGWAVVGILLSQGLRKFSDQ